MLVFNIVLRIYCFQIVPAISKFKMYINCIPSCEQKNNTLVVERVRGLIKKFHKRFKINRNFVCEINSTLFCVEIILYMVHSFTLPWILQKSRSQPVSNVALM